METEQLPKWIAEVRQQCRFGKMAWQGVRSSLNGMDPEKTFFYVHALLDRTRQVAGLLWSTQAEAADRCSALRSALGVADGHPLQAPELTFFATATDEQFGRWLGTLDHLHYLGMNVMPQGTMADFQQDTFLRSLDPEVLEFSWYDRRIALRPLVMALRELESVAESWLKQRSLLTS